MSTHSRSVDLGGWFVGGASSFRAGCQGCDCAYLVYAMTHQFDIQSICVRCGALRMEVVNGLLTDECVNRIHTQYQRENAKPSQSTEVGERSEAQ